MDNKEAIIKKIENLLALASNNPNEHEAIAAALKAQELMAKYNVELADIEGTNPSQDISKEVYDIKKNSHYVNKWRYKLSNIIARNFCCKTYTIGKEAVAFYGYANDAKICKQVFQFLYETGNRLAERYYRKCKKEGRNTKGVLNTYLVGFCEGIAEVLDRQCTALMLVISKEVEEAYKEHSMGFRKVSNKLITSNDNRAFQTGKREGRDTATARTIEGQVS